MVFTPSSLTVVLALLHYRYAHFVDRKFVKLESIDSQVLAVTYLLNVSNIQCMVVWVIGHFGQKMLLSENRGAWKFRRKDS